MIQLLEEKRNDSSSFSGLEYILANLFFLLVLFPYTTFGLPSFADSQPWTTLLGVALIALYFLKSNRRIGMKLLIFWFTLMLCIINLTIFLLFEGGSIIMYLRALYKYLAFAFIIPSAMIYFPILNPKILHASIIVWWGAAILQLLLKRPVIGFLLHRTSFLVGRNFALGFAPEPAYLAKIAIFFLLLIDFYRLERKFSKRSSIFLGFLCIWMIIQSASLTGFFLLSVYMLMNIIFIFRVKYNLKNLIISFSLVCLLVLVAPGILPQLWKYISSLGRLGQFLISINKQGLILALISDPNFVSRSGHVISIGDIFVNKAFFGYGVPASPTGSIFSVVYETGIYGLLLLFLIFYDFWGALRRAQSREIRFFVIKAIVLFAMLTFSESLATSYIGFTAGLMTFLSMMRNKIKIRNV